MSGFQVTCATKQRSLPVSGTVGGPRVRAERVFTVAISTLLWASAATAQTLDGASLEPFSLWDEAGFTADDAASGRWSVSPRQTLDADADSLAAARILPLTGTIEPAWSAAEPGAWAVNPIRIERTDLWRDTPEGGRESLRVTTAGVLRRADGAPVALASAAFAPSAAWMEPQAYDVRYDYHWPSARTTTASGWQVALTPHAGVGYGSLGGSAQAGATLKLGKDLESVVPSGEDAFGDRARWYLFAAGEGRAVGYNFARNRDGGFDRSGMSHDEGAFFGDATLGVAWRRGPMQASVGLTYREIEAEGLRLGRRHDDKVDEGLIAFQLSIKP